MTMRPYHEVRDLEHMRRWMESLEANGWVGAPLVVWEGEYLLPGSHRYAAAKELGWADAEIPTIELAEVFLAGPVPALGLPPLKLQPGHHGHIGEFDGRARAGSPTVALGCCMPVVPPRSVPLARHGA